MTDRKTLTIPTECYDLLEEQKLEDESWDDCLTRLAEGDGEHSSNTASSLDPADIDDIAAEVERRVERVLDNRMVRR